MARTASTMLPLGTPVPSFQLPDTVSGAMISPETFADKKGLLVMFICQHCPFVKHVQQELAQLGKDVQADIGVIAISANDIANHPTDAPPYLKAMAETLGFTFPVCYDETQEVAKAFTAACTPDFFLFDGDRQLVYRGQLDDSRPGNDKPVTGADLRGAIAAIQVGTPVNPDQQPSIGCNIKWKPGNAPSYYG
ncbi:MAG: thioredoxin family protein [Synechococcales cyanobacterium T60_A2020_003]|nr:thioredoxin family protein [Synechococcales cyanobacterium T60_A2020_003]